MWNWCSLILLTVLIIVLVSAVIIVSCFCAIYVKKGPERRATPAEYYGYPMDLYPPPQRPYMDPRAPPPLPPPPPPLAYSQQQQQQPPMLTPYQQYLVAQNWSNMYKTFQQNQTQNSKQKT